MSVHSQIFDVINLKNYGMVSGTRAIPLLGEVPANAGLNVTILKRVHTFIACVVVVYPVTVYTMERDWC